MGLRILWTLLLGLWACSSLPQGLDDPDDIPDHPVTGQLGEVDFELTDASLSSHLDEDSIALYDTRQTNRVITFDVPAGFVGEEEAWKCGTRMRTYDEDSRMTGDWLPYEGWVVIDSSEAGVIEGRLAVLARDAANDHEPIAWAEGTFVAEALE